MDFATEDFGETRVITPRVSRIDAAAAVVFKDQVRALARGGPSRIILDLAEVGFIDSSGLGAVVALFKQLTRSGSMELASLQPPVDKLFSMTRLDSVFVIHKSRETALDGA